MHTGVLWYDNVRGDPLRDQLERAAGHYRRKYHKAPNLCLVHPSMLEAAGIRHGSLAIRAYTGMLPGHFWIGSEDRPRSKRATGRWRPQMPGHWPHRA